MLTAQIVTLRPRSQAELVRACPGGLYPFPPAGFSPIGDCGQWVSRAPPGLPPAGQGRQRPPGKGPKGRDWAWASGLASLLQWLGPCLRTGWPVPRAFMCGPVSSWPRGGLCLHAHFTEGKTEASGSVSPTHHTADERQIPVPSLAPRPASPGREQVAWAWKKERQRGGWGQARVWWTRTDAGQFESL